MHILEKERKTKEVELTKKGEEFTVRKGAYHRATGIPQDEKIPMSRINADIKKGGKIGRMARSAKGFKAMHHKGESDNGNGSHPAVLEKEHPKKALGTVKGHKTTKKQQKLFGIARGMQKGQTSKSYSPQAAKLAKSLSGKEVHKIASKPKGGFRRKSSKSESALMREAEERVMQLVREEEARLAEQEFSDALGPGADPTTKKPRRRSELMKKRGGFKSLSPGAASAIQKPFDKMRRRLEKRP